MGLFSQLSSSTNQSQNQLTPINPKYKWFFAPQLPFGQVYGLGLSAIIPPGIYLATGRWKTAFVFGVSTTALIWQMTHKDLNWHRIRYGNYVTFKYEMQQQALKMDKERIESSFKRQTGKDIAEFSEQVIQSDE